MLAFFPSPYPDELLYGVCARYHQRSGNPSFKATTAELFGSASACAVTDLPCRLGSLSAQLSPGTLNTPERLIKRHTLLPLYGPFLPPRRLSTLMAWMEGTGRGGSIHMAIGAMASSVPAPRFLHYCPDCLRDDSETFGETYWHRSHQVAGVRICHRHEIWLHESETPAAAPPNKHVFQLPPSREASGRPLGEENPLPVDLTIARAVAWLLAHPDTPCRGLDALRKIYLRQLHCMDLASYEGRVDQREFLARFARYFGNLFLRQCHCAIDAAGQDNWLSALVRKPRKASHPLRHILLTIFLGLDLEDLFFQHPAPDRPFGQGPWPCLNAAAEHFRQPVIPHCVITRQCETGAPVGNFYCSCGFNYSRSGPDRHPDDQFKRGRIIAVGPVWEAALVRLRDQQGFSLRATARTLAVDVNTVTRYLARLAAGPPEEVRQEEDQRKIRRECWLALRAQHPQTGRKGLRSLAKADYVWLYRHDRDWLLTNLPPARSRKRSGKPRVNWAMRDRDLAARILPAALEIRECAGKPVRVTVSAIGKKLGVLVLLQKKLAKLPKTRANLERVLETRKDFQVRRVQLAALALEQRGEPLNPWRIIREAGLRPGPAAALRDEITKNSFLSRKDNYGT